MQPTNVYFGQKDAAQCVLIKRIVEDLDMDCSIQIEDTVREPDGLALSSRNVYLDAPSRRAAPVIYQALCNAQSLFKQETPVASSALQTAVESTLQAEPLVTEIQYISVASAETMQEVNEVTEAGAIVSVACKVGGVRLIDNIRL